MRVTVVTVDAERDDLTEQDYREIYNELRGQDPARAGAYAVSLDRFVQAIGSHYTKGLWSKWQRWWVQEKGANPLNREMRSELRQAVGLPPLAATVVQAVAGVDPNAQVVQVGDRVPDQVVLVGVDGPIRLHINGTVRVEEQDPGEQDNGEAGRAPARSDLRRDYRPRVSGTVRAAMEAAGFASAEAAILFAVAAREADHA